jgi:hypothetical protein
MRKNQRVTEYVGLRLPADWFYAHVEDWMRHQPRLPASKAAAVKELVEIGLANIKQWPPAA